VIFSLLGKVKHRLREDGVVLTVKELFERGANLAFSLGIGLKLGRGDIRVHRVSRIRGASHISIGKNFHAGRGLWLEAVTGYLGDQFEPVIEIGDDVYLSEYVHISAANHIQIGSGVLMGSKIYISDNSHGRYNGADATLPTTPAPSRKLFVLGSVQIGSNVWIGDSVVIIGNVSIGDGAVIAANSVITKNVESYSMVGGVPARLLKKYSFDSQRWERQSV